MDFIARYSDSGTSLRAWARQIEQGDFKHLIGLRQVFGTADYVAPHTVFNISGNKYRLIALVNYALKAVSVEKVLTHAEYDKDKWRR